MADDKWSGSNPWLGLASYTEGVPLYGRTKESVQLADIIKDNMASVVFGKSGIGKSSLLSAGISPLLREENYIPVRIRLVHNTDISYSEQIESEVRKTVKCTDHLPTDVKGLGLWDFFHRHSFTSGDVDCTPVIVLDQFEEIYTLTDTEHKKDIIMFFNELSSLLNDIKPDNVIAEERKHSFIQNDSASAVPKQGIIKRSAASALNYTSATTFRFVICLREDKLYLLERNSANIPSLKANRYNLQALSRESALEVIMCPRPELFTNEEATAIIDKLANMWDEGIQTIDPAILSLFLYKYYEKQGQANYDNIFADYYQEATKDIDGRSMAFLEDQLLTLGGYRKQVPLDDALSSGVTQADIQSLLQRIIIRKEKRNHIDYIEFSHDRLCEEAKQRRESRKLMNYRTKIYNLWTVLLVLLGFCVSCVFIYLSICENVIPGQGEKVILPDNDIHSINIKYGEQATDSMISALDSCHSVSVNFFHRSLYSFDNMLYGYGISGGEGYTRLIGYAHKAKSATIVTGTPTCYYFYTANTKDIYILYNPAACIIELPDTNQCTLHIPYGTMRDILNNGSKDQLLNRRGKYILNTVYDIKEMSVLETWYRRLLLNIKKEFHCCGEDAAGNVLLKTPLSWLLQIISITLLIPLVFVYYERKSKVFNNIKFSLSESVCSYVSIAIVSSFFLYVLFFGFDISPFTPVYGPLCVSLVMYIFRKYMILQGMRKRFISGFEKKPFLLKYHYPSIGRGRFCLYYLAYRLLMICVFFFNLSIKVMDSVTEYAAPSSDFRSLLLFVQVLLVFGLIYTCNRRCRTLGISCWIQIIPGSGILMMIVK